MIGAEPVPPYQRPPLSKKYLLGEMSVERLYLRPLIFYAEQEIDLRTGVSVVSIDRSAKLLALSDESTLAYGQLALTTGSRPRLLPAAIGGSLNGVYAVRTLADVDAMAVEFVTGRRLLIIGGGYIGLEAAAVARLRGMQVTLIEIAERILQRVAAVETSNYFRALHKSHGVDIREGIGLTRLEGSGRVQRALLSDGSVLEVDCAVAGVGIVPDTRLAEIAGLAVENGVRVDSLGRSSDPAIFAAGDCASFPYQGGRVRLESVPNAIDMAEAVAGAMLGGDAEYLATPWFWSDQYEVKLQIAGLNNGYDRVVMRAGLKEGSQSVWYYCGAQLLAVDAMNDPRAYMTGKRWIEAGISPLAKTIGDPTSELKTIA